MACFLGSVWAVWPISPSSVFPTLHKSSFPYSVFLKSWQILTEFSVCPSVPDFTKAALLITEFLDNEYKVVSLLPSTTFFQMQARASCSSLLPECSPTLLALWLPQKHHHHLVFCAGSVAKTRAFSPLSESSLFQGVCLRKEETSLIHTKRQIAVSSMCGWDINIF